MEKTLKILHLEDVKSDAYLVAREIQKGRFSHKIVVVDNAKDYAEALDAFEPDIILSDNALPAYSSCQALAYAKKNGFTIPFILVTGNISEEFAVTMMKAGASDYILKDRMQRLPNAILNALEQYRLKSLQQRHIEDIIASEQLFKQAESIAQFGTWKIDIFSGKSTWSEQTYCLLGYSPLETSPSYKNFLRHIIASDVPKVKQAIRKAFRHSYDADIEFGVKADGGIVRIIRSKFIVERDRQNNPVSITGFIQDITKMRRAEESLYKSKANLQTIFENTDTGFILIDENFIIQSYNIQAQTFIQDMCSKRLLEGRSAIQYISEHRKKEFESLMTAVLHGEKISHEINCANENPKWYDVNWAPISNVMYKRLGLIISITDITHKKLEEVEKENNILNLIQRNQELQQFNFIVSHNLRGPLTNIMGLTHVLKNLSDDQILSYWKQIIPMIETCSSKLDQVILDLNTILDLRRQLSDGAEKIDLYDLIDEVKGLLPLNFKNDVELEYDFNEMPLIKSIKSYWLSIFTNLITNSIKFKKPGVKSNISIKLICGETNIEIVFRDNGRGLDTRSRKEEIFKIYSRFYEDVEGRGMGLFMVKTQVELLGGKIDINGEINQGMTTTVSFPKTKLIDSYIVAPLHA